MPDQIATADTIEFGDSFMRHRISGHAVHGGRFNVPLVSHVEGNLYQGGVPEYAKLELPEGFKHVFSLVHGWWEYLRPQGCEYHPLTMYDSLSQTCEAIDEAAQEVVKALEDGPVLVHCQAGLNRSGLLAARTLMYLGDDADTAIEKVRQRSDQVLCNETFENWLRENPVDQ